MKPAEMKFSKVTTTEKGGIEQMLFDRSICQIGHPEISLRVIVEAGQGADISNRDDNDAEDAEEDDNSTKDGERISCEAGVIDGHGGTFGWCFKMASLGPYFGGVLVF